MKLHLPTLVWLAVSACALAAASATSAAAAPASHLEVRVVTGAQELSAGGLLELRIYEGSKGARHLPLTHGEAWPRDSTHLIPVKLTEPLDPRNVVRFSLYYRSASPLTPDLEIAAADVELPAPAGAPELLLGATLSGVVGRQGELATMDRDQSALACRSDADCDDKRTCNGQEHCAPHSQDADARGCVKGSPVVCPVNQVCSEGVGCRGLAGAPKP